MTRALRGDETRAILHHFRLRRRLHALERGSGRGDRAAGIIAMQRGRGGYGKRRDKARDKGANPDMGPVLPRQP